MNLMNPSELKLSKDYHLKIILHLFLIRLLLYYANYLLLILKICSILIPTYLKPLLQILYFIPLKLSIKL